MIAIYGYINFNLFMQNGNDMSDNVYKSIELTGSSTVSIEKAVQNAIAKANETVSSLEWFQVVETRGYIDKAQVAYWQVTIKIGFKID